jgi:hypothetical protein
MAKNPHPRFNRPPSTSTASRKLLVIRMALRGKTLDEITQQLQDAGVVNPRSGKPWSRSVIHKDLTDAAAAWKADVQQATEDLQSRILAEIREVRRRAWNKDDLKTVLASIKQERDLLGLDAPTRVQIDYDMMIQQVLSDLETLDIAPEERAAIVLEARDILTSTGGDAVALAEEIVRNYQRAV